MIGSLLQSLPQTQVRPKGRATIISPSQTAERLAPNKVAKLWTDPHLVLLLMAGVVLVLERFRGSATFQSSALWPILQCVVAAAAFLVIWREQSRLKLLPIISIALLFQLGWIMLHMALGVEADKDARLVYPGQGSSFLAGTYPRSEYPVGGVLLFAFESLLSGSGNSVRLANALLMVPFQLVTVIAVWSFRTRFSAWFAALVALWPLNAFYLEFKYDAAPTAALAIGLLLATRRRWSLAGVAFGIGAALKWTPGLAGVVLAVWLMTNGQRRAAVQHFCSLIGTFLLVYLPFLLWSASNVLAAYVRQGGRGITAESVFYIPLLLFGAVQPEWRCWRSLILPIGFQILAILVQLIALGALIWFATRVRQHKHAIALAAMMPVVFLLTNRIFSAQFLVLIVAVWAIVGSLLVRNAREQILIGIAIFGATLANVIIYPTRFPSWFGFSVAFFVLSFAVTGWLLVRCRESQRERGYELGDANEEVDLILTHDRRSATLSTRPLVTSMTKSFP